MLFLLKYYPEILCLTLLYAILKRLNAFYATYVMDRENIQVTKRIELQKNAEIKMTKANNKSAEKIAKIEAGYKVRKLDQKTKIIELNQKKI